MFRLLPLGVVLTALFCIFPSATLAQSVCDSVLRPTVVSDNSSEIALLSYVNHHAEEEYERLKKKNQQELSADATYKVFSGAFHSSRNKEEFRSNARKTLTHLGFTQIEQRVRSYYRSGLQDAQIAGWVRCMEINVGGLGLVAADVTKDGFTLRGTWRPGLGVPPQELKITLVGGTILHKGSEVTELTDDLPGGRDFRFIVKRANNSRDVRVIGETSAQGADFLVPIILPVKKEESVVQECPENDPCVEGAKVIDCFTSNERPREVPGSPLWLFKTDEGTSGNYVARQIMFGAWDNAQCGLSGIGWHTAIGSCEKGGGTKHQRCTKVKVHYIKTTYVDPPQ